MRFSRYALTAMAVLSGVMSAADQAPAAAQSPAQVAMQMFPKCALFCLAKIIPKSACSQTDVPCLCTNVPLNTQLAGCIMQSCTTYEGLMSKNASMTMCGAPVRNETAKPLLIGVIGGAITFFIFGLRMCAGLPVGGRPWGWDDFTIVIAMALAIPPTVFAVTLSNNGLGKDMWTLPQQQIENVLYYYYLGELFYFAALTATKLSILFFILRVFGMDQKFRPFVYGAMALCLAYGIAFITCTALQCSPISYSWEQIDSKKVGKCNDIHLQGWMSAICNIVIDIIILVLPLKKLAGLQMKLKKKLMIMFMFSLGIFVTIVSVIRLRSLILFANSQNITWDYTEAAWWSTVEIDVGIICACLPSLRSLFIALGVKKLGSTNGNSHGHSSGKRLAGIKPGTNKSGMSSTAEKSAKSAPRQGDERDFIPLVDVDNSKSDFGESLHNVHSTVSASSLTAGAGKNTQL
ncbi:CFEM domain-containing protein [Colletotrichum graminicola]|uniref:CFEM domain-containing protein n=1 Tax=Colletotrichum graminicola (strain M1.001 / M2 / FGSC 10212) TaxID=645133 RepID=E3QSD3_COLGM|nr:CFEM domain-containing protein [Colletotrichum graminicola M1.001]EFQ33760.1 CFEM domain-containing protein [Colletotrichum graminicola M1.001]WDK21028.1 CFEM domain-containing protein [Colletotrichum graminicola]